MNIKKKCQQINSLLGDLSSTGIQPIPDIVYEMRLLLHKIEAVEQPLAPDRLWRVWAWVLYVIFLVVVVLVAVVIGGR